MQVVYLWGDPRKHDQEWESKTDKKTIKDTLISTLL